MSESPNEDAVRIARAATPRLVERTISGGETPDRSRELQPSTQSRAARAAILESLHTERGTLTRKRRLGGLTPEQASQLAELEAYIDELELEDERVASVSIWTKLDEIAARVVSIGAAVERNR